MSDLDPKPCPFCGEPPVMRGGGLGLPLLECISEDCGAACNGSLTEAMAVDLWNRRAPPATTPPRMTAIARAYFEGANVVMAGLPGHTESLRLFREWALRQHDAAHGSKG